MANRYEPETYEKGQRVTWKDNLNNTYSGVVVKFAHCYDNEHFVTVLRTGMTIPFEIENKHLIKVN